MRNATGWVLLPLMAGLMASAPVMAQGAGKAQEDYLAKVAAAVDQAGTDDYEEACRTMRRLRNDRAFDTLPRDRQARVLAEAGYVYLSCNQPAEALPELKASAAIEQGPWNLGNLAVAAGFEGEADTAARAIIDLAARWPQTLDDTWARRAWSAYHGLGDNPALQRKLFEAFFDANYRPAVGDNSAMWYALARLRLDAGDTDAARAAASRVVDGVAVVRMRVDRRFDPIVVRDARRFDARRQAEVLVDTLRRQGNIFQQDIDVWIDLTYAQLTVGDHQGVIDEVTRVLNELDASLQADGSAPGWLNADKRAWLLNNRAIAHARLGNVGLAIDDLRWAAELPEEGGPNFSQKINLGMLLCYAGRPDEIERHMRGIPEEITAYGQVLLSLVRLCAAAQRNDRAAMQSHYAIVQRNAESTDAVNRVESHLWMGDLAAAEREFLQMLERPDERANALLMAQPAKRTPGLPGRALLDRNRDALLARPAVKAAIDKVGRVEPVDLYLGIGFD